MLVVQFDANYFALIKKQTKFLSCQVRRKKNGKKNSKKERFFTSLVMTIITVINALCISCKATQNHVILKDGSTARYVQNLRTTYFAP